jgi:hypothetical protein
VKLINVEVMLALRRLDCAVLEHGNNFMNLKANLRYRREEHANKTK